MSNIAVMYHYVRPQNGWKGIVPLSPSNFANQIDMLSKKYNIISPDQICNQRDRTWCILTFDDGTKDQFTYAFDILKKKGVPAYFAVMSSPILNGKIPIVHLVHTVLSFKTDEEIWELLQESYDIRDIENQSKIYSYEKNKLRRYNKYMLNFKLTMDESKSFLEKIFFSLFPDKSKFIDNFYLNEQEIREMNNQGMCIGVHCHNHVSFTGNSIQYFEEEILPCKLWLEQILKSKISWYTPPFGGKNSSGASVKDLTEILMHNGFKGAFTTEHGYISNPSSFWMNRIDCNKVIN